jgi:hypothetical protein
VIMSTICCLAQKTQTSGPSLGSGASSRSVQIDNIVPGRRGRCGRAAKEAEFRSIADENVETATEYRSDGKSMSLTLDQRELQAWESVLYKNSALVRVQIIRISVNYLQEDFERCLFFLDSLFEVSHNRPFSP